MERGLTNGFETVFGNIVPEQSDRNILSGSFCLLIVGA